MLDGAVRIHAAFLSGGAQRCDHVRHGPVVVNGDRALGQLLFALRIKRRRSALEMTWAAGALSGLE